MFEDPLRKLLIDFRKQLRMQFKNAENRQFQPDVYLIEIIKIKEELLRSCQQLEAQQIQKNNNVFVGIENIPEDAELHNKLHVAPVYRCAKTSLGDQSSAHYNRDEFKKHRVGHIREVFIRMIVENEFVTSYGEIEEEMKRLGIVMAKKTAFYPMISRCKTGNFFDVLRKHKGEYTIRPSNINIILDNHPNLKSLISTALAKFDLKIS